MIKAKDQPEREISELQGTKFKETYRKNERNRKHKERIRDTENKMRSFIMCLNKVPEKENQRIFKISKAKNFLEVKTVNHQIQKGQEKEQ